MRWPFALSSLAVLALAAACGGSGGTTVPPASSSSGKHVDAATAGTVTGRVMFEGEAPAPKAIKMGADPACTEGASSPAMDDAVLVKDGALQNVFVYVKEGLDPAYTFDAPKAPLQFDQRGCRYVPRVFGVRAGQPIEIINDDNTLHNVHALPKTNPEFNQSLQLKGQKMTKTFTTPEVMVRFKCDVHNWMTAYVGVMAHPFFAVTSDTGAFSISGLPPGTYTVEAWHEKLGTQTQKVTVGDRQTQTVAFTLAAPKG
jgi:plastocyanin